jgi:hypothetical protein
MRDHIAICDLVWVNYMTRICIYWFDESVSFEIKMIDLDVSKLTWYLLWTEFIIMIIVFVIKLFLWNENESLSHLFSFNLGYFVLLDMFCERVLLINEMQYFVKLNHNIVLVIDLIENVFKSWWLCFWWDSFGSSVTSLSILERVSDPVVWIWASVLMRLEL